MFKLNKLAGLAFAGVMAATVMPTTAFAKAPVPIDYFAIRHGVSDIQVSPDGKHVFVLKLESKDGQNVLEIYSTDDFSKPLKRLNGATMELFSAQWVSDDVISGNAFQWVRKHVKRPEDSGWDMALYSYDLRTEKFKRLEPDKANRAEGNGFTIVNNLVDEPNEILIATGSDIGADLGIDPFALFRPRNYYRYNLTTGNKRLVLRGNIKYGAIRFNGKGVPIFASGGNADHESIQYYRPKGTKDWVEFGRRRDADSYEDLYDIIGGASRVVGMKQGDPTTAIVIDPNGADKAALWEYDLVNDKFGRKIFSTPDADVTGTMGHSNTWGEGADSDQAIVAVTYPGAKRERHWFDMKEKALYAQFESKIPNAHSVGINSRSRDGKTMIVTNRGPKDPGSFWLVKNGKMAKLGSRNPLLGPDDLANVEYIRYPARDGQIVPAYVTKPNTPGPWPLIVLPHGGPHVNEIIGFDEWGQFLANNGYMVLQPQYRMSTGWGKKHFDSALGQHGLAMQDDKDDGAQYLIDKGWAIKDKMAMFGWSYGGYAALVAASRPNNMYQCVIAGAAVADPKKVYLKRKGKASTEAANEWSRSRGGYVGINPIEEVSKVNVPVFMVHGDLDARVLYFNFKDYRKAMKKAGKKARYLTLKQADHYSVFLTYKHQKEFYTELLDFLATDCGMPTK